MLSFQWLISKHFFNVTLIEIMKYGVSIFLQVQSNKIQTFVKIEYYSALKKISILIPMDRFINIIKGKLRI